MVTVTNHYDYYFLPPINNQGDQNTNGRKTYNSEGSRITNHVKHVIGLSVVCPARTDSFFVTPKEQAEAPTTLAKIKMNHPIDCSSLLYMLSR